MAAKDQTEQLTLNLHNQLSRLLTQLHDLEDLKDDLGEEDYIQTKAETIQQMKEFEESLGRVAGGNTTLVDEVSRMKLALQTKIAEAFQTPQVMKLFSSKQPNELRERLESLQRGLKLGKLHKQQVHVEIVEVLTTLKKLGEQLTEEEKAYLEEDSFYSRQAFESVKEDRGMVEKCVLSLASEKAHKR